LPLYVVTPKSGRTKVAVQSSPRIRIATDATTPQCVPEAVRFAADSISTDDLGVLQGQPVHQGVDGAIAWMDGDQLLQGSSEDLRRSFFSPALATVLVPVHLPCIPEADLVGVQPRLISAGAVKETLSTSVRIAGTTQPSSLARSVLKECMQPWAHLHRALLREQQPGLGIDALKDLWQRGELSPLLASLVLRNMILALLRQSQFTKAEELLTLGIRAYTGYADLHYLTAVLWIYRQKRSKAVAHLERAMQSSGRGYVGSGGENSYRCSFLLGVISGQIGNELRAAAYFIPGIRQRPAFGPSVAEILRLRFSRVGAEQLSHPLCEMVRREPLYLEAVFDFFIQHRVLDPPRRLLRTLPLSNEFREILEGRLSAAEAQLRPGQRQAMEKPGVVLEGPFLIHSGHARINRAIARSLIDRQELDAAAEPSEPGSIAVRFLPDGEQLARGLQRTPAHLDLTIRHRWPPNFRPPAGGRLACILPWEHRAVPRPWVCEIERWVDELWVPSQFVAEAFIGGGVNPSRVHVIPNGFDANMFHPGVAPWRPPGCRACAFLFVGGAIRRKGVDLLLQAYADAFSPDDDVTLIFKETGSSGVYQHNHLLPQIQKLARTSDAPHVIVLRDEMDDPTLGSLYGGCDALVLPFRGEGFGMPLLEAMACGKPVITTAAGPAMEFCSSEFAYLISAIEVPVPDPPPPLGEFTREWTWFEPDLVELAAKLRAVYENREEAAQRGRLAAERIAKTHAWPRITNLYLDRIAQLTGMSRPTTTPQLDAAQK
jgi:glycosyltransferase involved in cell wall biosynthesis